MERFWRTKKRKYWYLETLFSWKFCLFEWKKSCRFVHSMPCLLQHAHNRTTHFMDVLTPWLYRNTSAFDGRMEVVENINILSSCTCPGMAHAQVFTPSPSTANGSTFVKAELKPKERSSYPLCLSCRRSPGKEHLKVDPTSWNRERIVIDLLVSPCSFSFLLTWFHCFLLLSPFVFCANSPFV